MEATAKKKCLDIAYCNQQLKSVQNQLTERRTSKNAARLLSEAKKMSGQLPGAEGRKFKGLSENEIIAEFQRVYFEVLDTTKQQIEIRFNDLSKLDPRGFNKI